MDNRIAFGTTQVRWHLASRIVALGGVAALVLGACSRTEPNTSGMSVDTIAGVVHVRHTGNAAEWTLRELAAIGSADGPSAFGHVRSVVMDGDGNVYIADDQASEIRVFGPDGTHLRTIGRPGGGPGEFTELYSLAWMGDTLAVLDPRAGRISLLARSGEWIGQIAHEPMTGPDIRFHSVGRDVYSVGMKPAADGKLVQVYLRYAGGRIDTLPSSQQQSSGPASTILCRPSTGRGLTFFRNPFIAQQLQSPAPGHRIALVTSAAYRIAVLSAAGDTAMVIEKEHRLAPLTDAEWEEATRPHREWAASSPGAKCTPVEFTRPPGKPALRTIFFDDADRMWVEVVTAEGFSFDVFDPRGAHLGHLRAPARQRSVPTYVRGDRLVLVTADSNDVQAVRVFRIDQ
jgi:hypothetical protein